jgi:hypothetical protein
MAIFAALQEMIIAEGQDIFPIASHVVKVVLQVMVIRVTLILKSDARIISF